ncbi:uncharacterized protein G2W53_036714 [Senna tora]|uniref:Uncharacterized protein n=1 Tax=Senna tora TaxID=362788 RepID=A0A834SVP2_9FABA|nr:uncharacterized protein G2W53_036714 [Senna tora]
MEKKKKDKIRASACNRVVSETNAASKQDQTHTDVTLGAATAKISNSSHDNATTYSNQQYPPNLQWSYTPQNSTEQSPAISIPNQVANSPGVLNQWQQLPHQQQLGQQPFVQSTSPFWQPHLTGGPLIGGNVPPMFQTFTPLGTPDAAGWQALPVMAGGSSSRTHPLVPNICYHVGYTFPGFSGPWDPSWMGQMHQLQHPCAYSFAGALGHSSPTPRMPGCLDFGENSFQRGIIRPPAKLSQKHQQLWEAQSMENVQLWSAINNLQAEVADYKDRLMKVTEEVTFLKQKMEEPIAEVVGTVSAATRQPSKRGRPKRSVISVNALCESLPRARGRKAAVSKVQRETNSPIVEEAIFNKVENKGKAYNSTTLIAHEENNEKISSIAVTDVSGNFGINQSNSMISTFQAQVQEYQGIQLCGTAFHSASGVKGNAEKDPEKVMNNSMNVSAKYMESTSNGSVVWPSGIPSQDSSRNVLDITHQNFFHNGCFIQQGGKVTHGHGWNFANEEDASEELEDAVVGSAKDENENEEEMGDGNDTSSDAEEIDGSKDEGAYALNNPTTTSPKDLPPLNNW